MILVTGATGFLGKRLCRMLEIGGFDFTSTSRTLGVDLRDRRVTLDFFERIKPKVVMNCAAYVGGIQFGQKHTAEMFHNNLHMTLNLLEGAARVGVKRIVNPISNCAYPGTATLFKESEFWDGELHESVLTYGFVRKASWVGSWSYGQQYGLEVINLILSNMYGPEDHFEEERSHALGALIMKIVEAKENLVPNVVIWGSGKPVREWLYVDDGAEAMIRALDLKPTTEPINIGVGKGISIIDLACLIKKIVGYEGELTLDHSKMDGAPFKTMDGTKGADYFKWQPTRSISEGILETVRWYKEHRGYIK